MPARPSLMKHLGLAALAFLAFFAYEAATGKVADLYEFHEMMMGVRPFSIAALPFILMLMIPALIMLRYIAVTAGERRLRWIAGGALFGFLAGFGAAQAGYLSTASLASMALAGAVLGWLFGPRAKAEAGSR